MTEDAPKKKLSRRQLILLWALIGLAVVFMAFNIQMVKVHVLPFIGFEMPLALHLIAWLALGVGIGVLLGRRRGRKRLVDVAIGQAIGAKRKAKARSRAKAANANAGSAESAARRSGE
jgi:hypothetical protein